MVVGVLSCLPLRCPTTSQTRLSTGSAVPGLQNPMSLCISLMQARKNVPSVPSAGARQHAQMCWDLILTRCRGLGGAAGRTEARRHLHMLPTYYRRGLCCLGLNQARGCRAARVVLGRMWARAEQSALPCCICQTDPGPCNMLIIHTKAACKSTMAVRAGCAELQGRF